MFWPFRMLYNCSGDVKELQEAFESLEKDVNEDFIDFSAEILLLKTEYKTLKKVVWKLSDMINLQSELLKTQKEMIDSLSERLDKLSNSLDNHSHYPTLYPQDFK